MSATWSFWSVLLCMESGASRQVLLDSFESDVHARAVEPEEDLLGLLAHASPDLLLFASPTGGNLGLLRSVRAAHGRLPIVALALESTLSSEGFLERLGELSVTRFLELPLDPAEFRRRINGFLGSRRDSPRTPEDCKRFFRAGEVVFLENDAGRECFLLNAGKVEVSKALNRYTLHHIATVGPGEIFGESALLASGRRPATAIAREDSIVTVLTQQNFCDVMSATPAFSLELLDLFVRRLVEVRRRVDPSAAGFEDDWFHRETSHFASRPGPKPDLDRATFEPGEVLVMPGAALRNLYWILEGQVQVEYPAIGSLEAPPAVLVGPDNALGEVAFLTGDLLDIGAVAVATTTVAVIPREQFVAAVASRPGICLQLVQTLAARMRTLNESLGVREVLELA
ncbi:MAG: cyclic nucleotide-binding domain-containing protein [Candidatus Wallbacteria bacterium]|nr:cyclic nucleotide-binding domain-containing protein [Candidatus Wallbacteria bacterium]